jgi:hypothetical protein
MQDMNPATRKHVVDQRERPDKPDSTMCVMSGFSEEPRITRETCIDPLDELFDRSLLMEWQLNVIPSQLVEGGRLPDDGHFTTPRR